MRHSKKRYQLHRFTSWHKATVISMVRNLVIYQSIKTTKTKALAAKPLAEKLITLAKENTLAAKRRAFRVLGDHKLVSTLFSDIGPRFTNRAGGYVRIMNLANRRGDNAKVVIMELTEIKKKEIHVSKKSKEKTVELPKSEKTIHDAEVIEQKTEEKTHKASSAVKVKPPISSKPSKKFLGGLRQIFKKERDSL